MTPSGIEPATFLLVAQYLSQLCYNYIALLANYYFTRNMLPPVFTPVYRMCLVSCDHVTVMNIASICCEICGGMSNCPFMREYF
jgi:hypothetical protein